MHHLIPSALRRASLCAARLLGGCSGIPAMPPEVASITLTEVNSDRGSLWNVWLEKRKNRQFLSGHVYRHHLAAYEDTSKTHIAVTLFNVAGKRLLELPAEFTPSKIPHRPRMPGYSVFSIPLDMLPEGTTCIKVRAYDDSTTTSTPPARCADTLSRGLFHDEKARLF